MARGPGLYSDFGKMTRGLLYKDYQIVNKLTVTRSSATDVAIASISSDTMKGALFFGNLNPQDTQNNVSAYVEVDTSSNLSATFTCDEVAPGLKTIFSFEVPSQRPAKKTSKKSESKDKVAVSLAEGIYNGIKNAIKNNEPVIKEITEELVKLRDELLKAGFEKTVKESKKVVEEVQTLRKPLRNPRKWLKRFKGR
ncbi:mitochondrial outer membrane protein porin of 34 kDa-like [Silene latifolia]|uniref:mitochondrial outer membrane protein porin of 34 kDa-like n=1 Tax=Silene latifolia TaxID=37657 RepID=UPI003D7743EA